ncbi:SDR family oxidoreductase [Amycolatopsis carbonis]|uniref:SDR family oxidoreductase n=1 Tax=Amycolatopsis carbonis TaxID=715471 RepID=A0A9Y2IJ09_9PSEU|nr:SDR family oxidoreductase [Amycolatopsis sp. 2-15]WIX81007.1 SDR family oxidoreductase [Amycolatopsis sp. 2-15]
MNAHLRGKVALVTGGSRGLGAASVRKLAAAGADVAITYLQAADHAECVAESVRKHGVRAETFQADQADFDQVRGMVDAVAEQFGRIDILVNNAGTAVGGVIGEVPQACRDRIWAVNVHGLVATTEQVIAHMPDGGRIINVGSVAGLRVFVGGLGDYGATKAAVGMYAHSWAHELAPRRITVHTVLSGWADTELAPPPSSPLGQQVLAQVPLGRYADPDEIAGTIAFLAGPAAAYITGTDLRVDGGRHA